MSKQENVHLIALLLQAGTVLNRHGGKCECVVAHNRVLEAASIGFLPREYGNDEEIMYALSHAFKGFFSILKAIASNSVTWPDDCQQASRLSEAFIGESACDHTISQWSHAVSTLLSCDSWTVQWRNDIFTLKSMGGVLKGLLSKALNYACQSQNGSLRSEMYSGLFNRISRDMGLDVRLLIPPAQPEKRQRGAEVESKSQWLKLISSAQVQHKGRNYNAAGSRASDAVLENQVARMSWR